MALSSEMDSQIPEVPEIEVPADLVEVTEDFEPPEPDEAVALASTQQYQDFLDRFPPRDGAQNPDLDGERPPSSIEAQADPSGLSSFDLDFDHVQPAGPSNQDTKETLPDAEGAAAAAATAVDDFDEDNYLAGIFDAHNTGVDNGSTTVNDDDGDIKSDAAFAGVCGFRNFANTCYMNSGLQCLMATPTMVRYFTEECDAGRIASLKEAIEEKADEVSSLCGKFGPLLKNVWAGEYSTLKPFAFKSTLEMTHPQFKGAHQHDCQEFLALLLGSLHEELKNNSKNRFSREFGKDFDGGTSMELHTPHSTERDIPVTLNWIEKKADEAKVEHSSSSSKTVSQVVDQADEGSDSRGSASPKSYDSVASSVEDKVASEIRKLPIPNEVKGDDEVDTTSNLVPAEELKKRHRRMSGTTVTNNLANNGLEFLQKENKTLNVNVLAGNGFAEEIQNNKINFDSEKFHNYSHQKNLDVRTTIDNLANSRSSRDNQGKAVKEKNNFINDFHAIKRMRLDSNDKNVQLEMERSDDSAAIEESSIGEPSFQPAEGLKEIVDADRSWEKYLALNDTVVARTFQGQFKNTVVCSECKYVSVSFEPFMYLPVPLPQAHIRQMEVTFVDSSCRATEFLLQMTNADNILKLKDQVINILEWPEEKVKGSNVQIAEVFDHHVVKILEDWTTLKFVKDEVGRKIYALEVSVKEEQPMEIEVELPKTHCVLCNQDSDQLLKFINCQCLVCSSCFEGRQMCNKCHICPECSKTFKDGEKCKDCKPEDVKMEEEKADEDPLRVQSCVICMEDFPVDQLRQHDACDCVMCSPCLDRTIEHSQADGNSVNCALGLIKCPGCRQDVNPDVEFVPVDQIGKMAPSIKMLTLPLVFRVLDTKKEKIKKDDVTLFGHPMLTEIPNVITGRQLFETLKHLQILEDNRKFTFKAVNGQGKNCSRCIFDYECFGCVVLDPTDNEKTVILQASDTIAVSYFDEDIHPEEHGKSVKHYSMRDIPRIPRSLNLEDCLKAFSETEILDENNPWYCPVCRKNQCATKTLTVWRFPDYLIVYLKRFVFLSNSAGALKLEKDVEFKVDNLDLTPYLSGPLQHGRRGQGEGRPIFNLYGCVCHFGSVYGGHYTAFSKHLGSGQWNYFDDNAITPHKVPGQSLGDNSSAYILFYQRTGSIQDDQLPSILRANANIRAFAALGPDEESGQLTSTEKQNNDEKCDEFFDRGHLSGPVKMDDEGSPPSCPDISQLIRSLDTPPPSS